jgi:hypothetical protein
LINASCSTQAKQVRFAVTVICTRAHTDVSAMCAKWRRQANRARGNRSCPHRLLNIAWRSARDRITARSTPLVRRRPPRGCELSR